MGAIIYKPSGIEINVSDFLVKQYQRFYAEPIISIAIKSDVDGAIHVLTGEKILFSDMLKFITEKSSSKWDAIAMSFSTKKVCAVSDDAFVSLINIETEIFMEDVKPVFFGTDSLEVSGAVYPPQIEILAEEVIASLPEGYESKNVADAINLIKKDATPLLALLPGKKPNTLVIRTGGWNKGLDGIEVACDVAPDAKTEEPTDKKIIHVESNRELKQTKIIGFTGTPKKKPEMSKDVFSLTVSEDVKKELLKTVIEDTKNTRPVEGDVYFHKQYVGDVMSAFFVVENTYPATNYMKHDSSAWGWGGIYEPDSELQNNYIKIKKDKDDIGMLLALFTEKKEFDAAKEKCERVIKSKDYTANIKIGKRHKKINVLTVLYCLSKSSTYHEESQPMDWTRSHLCY